MPNYTKREQELLGPAHLALTKQSRQPALGQIDDAGIYDLLEQLGSARREAEAGEEGNPGPAEMLRAAIRRVDAERRKRGLQSARAVAAADGKHAPKPAPVGGTPATKVAAGKAATGKPTTRRRAATVARKSAGRKSVESRKTDLRTEPHRVAKPRPSETVDPTDATRDNAMTDRTAEKAGRQAARQVEKEAAKATEKDAARQARKAEKEAAKLAEKAARQAEKDAQKEARKAERKAAKEAEKEAARQARKAEKKARKDAEKKAAKSSDKAEKPEKPAKAEKPQKPAKAKSGAGKGRKGK